MSTPHARMAELEAAIRQSPDRALDAEEVRFLSRQRQLPLVLAKALGVHFFKRRNFVQALPYAQAVFESEQSSQAAVSLVVVLRAAGQTREALEFLVGADDMIEPIAAQDLACALSWELGETDAAVQHGTRALELKDALSASVDQPAAVTRPVDLERPGRNVIALSLWGTDPRYLMGARNNAIVARYLYPGWTLRVYHDDSVPQDAIDALTREGADLRRADWPSSRGLFWRFLVEDDEDIDLYIVRDADSVMTMRERAAVEDWLASGLPFHVMRDRPTHCELILAGMWGAHRGNLAGMADRIEGFLDARPPRMNDRTADQIFLRTEIWPLVRGRACVHDDWLDFGAPRRFREEFRLPGNRHIGQNDWVNRRR